MKTEMPNFFVDDSWKCSQIDARETFEDGEAVSVGILKQILKGLRFIPNSTVKVVLPNQSLIGRIIEWSWKNVRFS
jgi:hypothetical protein